MAVAMSVPVLPWLGKPAMVYTTVEELWGNIKAMFKDHNPIQWMGGAEPGSEGPPEARRLRSQALHPETRTAS